MLWGLQGLRGFCGGLESVVVGFSGEICTRYLRGLSNVVSERIYFCEK